MSVHGILVVDKPRGPTSHDVVARVRRALGTRAVGHAGTLDPMATGVLVLAVGEGTKLVSHLTGQDKEYEATVALGAETDTLDAEGAVVQEEPVPSALDRTAVERVAARFVGCFPQRAPAVSAIKVGGRALHRRVRAGEAVEAPVRQVEVRRLEIREVTEGRIALRVECAKGFYVRALARDLARALGTVGHLTELRRTRSGAFGLDRAVSWETVVSAASGDAGAREELEGWLIGLREAWADAPVAEVDEAGLADARHGRPVAADRIRGGMPEAAGDEIVAIVHAGRLVALARPQGDRLRVVRGIRESVVA